MDAGMKVSPSITISNALTSVGRSMFVGQKPSTPDRQSCGTVSGSMVSVRRTTRAEGQCAFSSCIEAA